MTFWPTTLESQVWPTPSTPVATEMAIIPATSSASSPSSFSGIATSSTSRSRNGEIIPSPADTTISPSTAARRPLYGAEEARRCVGSSDGLQAGVGSSAMSSTSSMLMTGWKVIASRTSCGTSSRSPRLRSGRITSVRPAAWAASTFCLSPPIGSTRPCSVTSPVMPTVCLIGRPLSRLASAVVMVMPALGPSLGIAPAGTWTWNSRSWNVPGSMPSSSAWPRT